MLVESKDRVLSKLFDTLVFNCLFILFYIEFEGITQDLPHCHSNKYVLVVVHVMNNFSYASSYIVHPRYFSIFFHYMYA